MTKPLNQHHQHEAGDRAFVAAQSFADFIAAHPFVSGNDHLRSLAEKIESDMAELYQAIWKTPCQG